MQQLFFFETQGATNIQRRKLIKGIFVRIHNLNCHWLLDPVIQILMMQVPNDFDPKYLILTKISAVDVKDVIRMSLYSYQAILTGNIFLRSRKPCYAFSWMI